MSMTAPSGPSRGRHAALVAAAALAVTALLWGSNHVAARSLHNALPLPSLIFWRWLLALGLLTPIALPGLIREWPQVRPRLPRLFALGISGIGLFSVFLYAGAYYSLALEVGLLTSTTPIWVVLMATLAGAPMVGRRQQIGIALALVGVLIIVLKGSLASLAGMELRIGNLWSLLAAIVFAWYTMLLGAKPLGLSALTTTAMTAWTGMISIIAPVYALFLLSGASDPVLTGAQSHQTTLVVLYIAIGPTLLGNLLWIYGASRLGAARSGPFLYLSPVAALVLSVTLLGEPLALFQVVGAVAILCGLAISNSGAKAPTPPPGA